MTISVVGAGTYATGTGNLTPTLHASTAENDLLIAFTNKRAATHLLAPPGGWTELYQHTETDAGGNASEMSFYGKIAGASESSPTFTATGTSAGSVQVLTVSTTQSFTIGSVVSNTAEAASSFLSNAPAASITPSVDNCLVLFGGKWRDTTTGVTAGALSGTTAIGQVLSGTTSSLLAMWNYVIQGTASSLTPGSWSISGGNPPSTTAAISVAIRETAASTFIPDMSPLYSGATLLASKTGIKYRITSGHTDLDGTLLDSGTDGTTDGSGIFQIPDALVSGAESDPVTVSLYFEEGSPVEDRSLIVKTTLTEVV